MGRRFPKTSTGMSQEEVFKQIREAYEDTGPLVMNRVIDTEAASELRVPDDFFEWTKKLPANARKKLSIHELRQIWELSQNVPLKFQICALCKHYRARYCGAVNCDIAGELVRFWERCNYWEERVEPGPAAEERRDA